MTIADETQQLVENIRTTRRDRRSTLDGLKDQARTLQKDTRDMLAKAGASRAEATQQLEQALANSVAEIKADVKGSLEGTHNMITACREERKEAGIRQAKELTHASRNRKQVVTGLIDGCRKWRKDTSAQLRNDWANAGAERHTSVSQAREEVHKLRGSTRDMVKDLQSARLNMETQLRDSLATCKKTLKADVGTMLADVRKEQEEFRTDLDRAAVIWNSLSPAGQGRQGEENLVGSDSNGGQARADMRERLLATIKEHPEGISLSDVAKNFGVMTVVLGKTVRELMNDGKIRREGKQYFPVVQETKLAE